MRQRWRRRRRQSRCEPNEQVLPRLAATCTTPAPGVVQGGGHPACCPGQRRSRTPPGSPRASPGALQLAQNRLSPNAWFLCWSPTVSAHGKALERLRQTRARAAACRTASPDADTTTGPPGAGSPPIHRQPLFLRAAAVNDQPATSTWRLLGRSAYPIRRPSDEGNLSDAISDQSGGRGRMRRAVVDSPRCRPQLDGRVPHSATASVCGRKDNVRPAFVPQPSDRPSQ